MLDLGARPLWVAKQTSTSLEMIEKYYGRARDAADELDQLIGGQDNVKPKGNPGGNPIGQAAFRSGYREPCNDESPGSTRAFCQSGRPGSNRRRPAWEAGALRNDQEKRDALEAWGESG